jgi:4-hydroxybenzoate polyprenyltransferase
LGKFVVILSKNQLFTLSKVFRHEYFLGQTVGWFAIFVLWYRPEVSPDLFTISLTLLFSAILYLCGFLANSIWDAELEIEYANEKRQLAQSVYETGKKRLLAMLLLGLCISFLLSLWLSIRLDSYIPSIFFLIGSLMGVGYSAPPFRWKERGFLLHAFTLGTAGMMLPMLLIVGILNDGFDWQILLLSLGYTLTLYGQEIGNQMKDYAFDKERGVKRLPFGSLWANGGSGGLILISGILIVIFMLGEIFMLTSTLIIMIAVLAMFFHHRPIKSYLRVLSEGNKFDIQNSFENLDYAGWQTQSMVGYLSIAALIRFSDWLL